MIPVIKIKDYKAIKQIIADPKLKDFIDNNLSQSLLDIGFKDVTVAHLLDTIADGNFEEFIIAHENELHLVHDVNFFEQFVPEFYKIHILKFIPKSKLALDIGCGKGVLARLLIKEKLFNKVIGLDIKEYVDWKEIKDSNLVFKLIRPAELENFLISFKADVTFLTWALHHMTFSLQEEYLKKIFNSMKNSGRLVLLEDSYASGSLPIVASTAYDNFMTLSEHDRQRVMSVYDWVANRVLARRIETPITFTYRTVEEWSALLRRIGFKIVTQRFIGFPNHRDINNPQSLIIASK